MPKRINDPADTQPATATEQEIELRAASSGPCAQGGNLADSPCSDPQSKACKALSRSRFFMLVLVLVTALGPLAMSSFIPAIPAIQAAFSVSGSVAQLTMSMSVLAMAVSSLAYGSLADRFGRRPVLLSGIAVGIVGSLVCAFGPTIETVIAGRALQAAGVSTGFVLSRVIVRDVYGDKRSASVLAYVAAAMTIAPMLGPILGGYLLDTSGWRAIFIFLAVMTAILLTIVATRLPETRPASMAPAGGSLGQGYGFVLQNAGYLKFLAYGAMSQATFFSFIAGAPYIMSETLGYAATVFGLYFIMVPAGYFVGSLLAGRFSGQLSHETMTLFGAVGGLATCVLGWLWVTATPTEPLALFIPAALMAIASGVALPSAQAGMLAAADRHSGAGSGLFSFVQMFASAIAAQLVGALQGFGPGSVFWVMAAASLIGLLGYLFAAARAKIPLAA